MKKQRGFVATDLLIILIFILTVGGWIANLVYLLDYDFEAPFKAEAIRATGVFIPPVGVVLGYITIDDGERK